MQGLHHSCTKSRILHVRNGEDYGKKGGTMLAGNLYSSKIPAKANAASHQSDIGTIKAPQKHPEIA